MKAVILAGGKGRRLRPYTTVFPKPLMPIGDKPILEIILNQLQHHGVDEAIIAVGHLPELIMAFFGNGSKFDINISYSKEQEPLGTAGCLGLMKEKLDEPFLMMNGDILTNLSFSDFFNFHLKSEAIASIALTRRNVHIDFGVIEIDGNNEIIGYDEKPDLHYLVSMGIYAFNADVLEYIEKNTYLDFPDLVKNLLSQGEKVKAFLFDDYWLDIGRMDDYSRANNEIGYISSILQMGDI